MSFVRQEEAEVLQQGVTKALPVVDILSASGEIWRYLPARGAEERHHSAGLSSWLLLLAGHTVFVVVGACNCVGPALSYEVSYFHV